MRTSTNMAGHSPEAKPLFSSLANGLKTYHRKPSYTPIFRGHYRCKFLRTGGDTSVICVTYFLLCSDFLEPTSR
jgi:hypothetical protein